MLIHSKKNTKIINGFFYLIILLGIINAAYRVFYNHPYEVAFSPYLIVDGNSYLKGAFQIIADKSWPVALDIYHSAGQQVYISSLFYILPKNPLSIKAVNLLMWILSLYLYGKVVVQLIDRKWQIPLVAFLSLSTWQSGYIATLNYEIIISFFMICIVFFYNKKNLLLVGILLGLVSFWRIHWAISFFALLLYYLYQKEFPSLIKVMIGYCLVSIPVLILYKGLPHSLSEHTVFRWISSNSDGRNFPYPIEGGYTGFNFIKNQPLEFLHLYFNKLCFLIGVKRDIWFIEPFWFQITTHSGLIWLNFVIFLLGSLFIYRSKSRQRWLCVLVLFIPLLITQLVVGSSSRFLVPYIPWILLIIVMGYYKSIKEIRKRLQSL